MYNHFMLLCIVNSFDWWDMPKTYMNMCQTVLKCVLKPSTYADVFRHWILHATHKITVYITTAVTVTVTVTVAVINDTEHIMLANMFSLKMYVCFHIYLVRVLLCTLSLLSQYITCINNKHTRYYFYFYLNGMWKRKYKIYTNIIKVNIVAIFWRLYTSCTLEIIIYHNSSKAINVRFLNIETHKARWF